MTLFAGVLHGQRILERLPDGSIRVEVEGKQYLAITRTQLDDWQILQNRFDAAQVTLKEKDIQLAEKQGQLNTALANVEFANEKTKSALADFERAKEDARRNLGRAIQEQLLREQLVAALPTPKKTGGVAGKMLDWLDSPAGQIGFRFVIPAAQAIKVFTTK